eukprot:9470073-Pyramimonas_sp.AAC.1
MRPPPLPPHLRLGIGPLLFLLCRFVVRPPRPSTPNAPYSLVLSCLQCFVVLFSLGSVRTPSVSMPAYGRGVRLKKRATASLMQLKADRPRVIQGTAVPWHTGYTATPMMYSSWGGRREGGRVRIIYPPRTRHYRDAGGTVRVQSPP